MVKAEVTVVVVMAITTGVVCRMVDSTGLLAVAMEEAATAEETRMAVVETMAVVDTEAEAGMEVIKVTKMEEVITEVLKATVAAAWEVAEEATVVEAWVVLVVAACNATRTTLSSSVALER